MVSKVVRSMQTQSERPKFYGPFASTGFSALKMRQVMRLRLQDASLCMPCVDLRHGRCLWALTARVVF